LLPIVALVGLVFVSLIFGLATATECAAWGVMGALILAWWSGTLTWDTFWGSVMGATRLMAMITLILSGAAFMSAAMAYTGIPVALADWVNALGLNSYALIAALTVMYAILGCFIDGISMIVLTTVVVLPMIKQAGFDLVWFGIFLVIMVEMAQITPPVGFNLFVIQTLTGKDSFTVARAALPFFLLLLIATVIITVFPNIALVLPRLAFPSG
jgi:tripartite ATP-independent transporter DctM subunit